MIDALKPGVRRFSTREQLPVPRRERAYHASAEGKTSPVGTNLCGRHVSGMKWLLTQALLKRFYVRRSVSASAVRCRHCASRFGSLAL